MSRNTLHRTHETYRVERTCIAAGLAMTAIFSTQNIAPHTLPEAAAATQYKMGGTGDPYAHDLPNTGGARQKNATPLVYPADPIDMPRSIEHGSNTIIEAVDQNTDQVFLFSQSALAGNHAMASGKMNGTPTIVSTANPAHSRVASHQGQGLANYAAHFGFPQLQSRSTYNYKGQIIEKCAQNDPICDFDPSKPLGQTAIDYFNIHLGMGPFNYNTVNPRRAIIEQHGNTRYVYYLQPGSRKKASATSNPELPVRHTAAAPATVEQPIISTPSVPSEPTPFVAPEPIVEAIQQTTSQIEAVAPQLTHIEQQVSTHLNNIAQIIPRLPQ